MSISIGHTDLHLPHWRHVNARGAALSRPYMNDVHIAPIPPE
ncbi:MAG: hypothetical protein QXJ56_07890 [Ignisphaera sp.]